MFVCINIFVLIDVYTGCIYVCMYVRAWTCVHMGIRSYIGILLYIILV